MQVRSIFQVDEKTALPEARKPEMPFLDITHPDTVRPCLDLGKTVLQSHAPDVAYLDSHTVLA